jgi:ABC-type multidrug transport system, ATPase component
MAEKKIILKTENLTKKYDTLVAVNDLNLEIQEGEIFGLLGPNGAGKTTTILLLLGLTEPAGGKATIAGHDCTRDPIGVKRMVGYLPDDVAFYNDMTAKENLRFIGQLNGLDSKVIEERAEELLQRVGLRKVADMKVGKFSRGMRQRLGIADVLMKDPKVVILDEPTLGIDPEGMRDLLFLIKQLAVKDGRTVLVSSHQLHQIQQICDRVGIFVKGKLIACGNVEELAAEVRGQYYTIEIGIGSDNGTLEKALRSISGVADVSRDKQFYVVKSESDIRSRLAAEMIRQGYALEHLKMRGGDLDDIYQKYFSKEGAV